MHDKKLYGTATVGTKGQVVIPAEARKELNLKEGDKLYVVGSEKGHFVGFVKEEQLRKLISKLTGSVEVLSSALEDK